MLEKSNKLVECEKLLLSYISDIRLISQIELRYSDVEKLRGLIKDELWWTNFNDGFEEIKNEYPTCLVCLLVWEGILGYKSGDYWSAVSDSIGTLTANQKVKLGQFFIDYLKQYNFPPFEIKGAHHYITPILAHGGIPEYCLNDFFENILWPIISGQLEIYTKEADEFVEEWESSSSLVYFTDKPVTRFLLYGGREATSFLSRCIEMAEYAYEENEVPSAYDLDLPPRIIKNFEIWWESRDKSVINRRRSLNRFKRPYLSLDFSIGEILIDIPSQKFETVSSEIFVEIISGTKDSIKNPLKTYYKNSCYETEAIQMVLKNPSNKYEIRLQVNGSIIKNWIIPGVRENTPYLLFSPDTMKLVNNQNGYSQIWIVYQRDHKVFPKNRIIEYGNEFYGNWKEYQSCLVSTVGTEQIILKKGHVDHILIPLEGEDFKFELFGGNFFELGYSEHIPICIGPPPQIKFLVSDISEFKRLHLTISPIGFSTVKDKIKHLVSDLVSFTSGEQTINLSDERLLGKKPIGRLQIHIRGQLGKEKRFNICCIPRLDAQFDRDMYFTTLDGIQPAILKLSVMPNNIISIIDHSTEIIDKSYKNGSIRLSSIERLIHCNIKIPLSSDQICFIPITIQIPRVYWSLRGLREERKFQNITQLTEINKDEWDEAQELYIIVTFLNCKYDKVMLKLIGTEHILSLKLNNGKVRFPLHAFSDSLKNTGRAIDEFFLIIGENPPVEIPIIRIRSEWEIDNLYSEDTLINGSRQLSLYWVDKGQPKNRIVRLNNLQCPWQKCISRPIPDGKSNIDIEEDQAIFLPGTYKIEFTIEDPWGHIESIPNCRIHELDVGIGERFPLEKIGKQLLITSLLDCKGHIHYINRHEYRINISSFIKTEGHEHIYKGQIYFRRFKKGELKAIKNANPINISYNQSNFTISRMLDKGGDIDVGGDGAYYCCICTKIFWSDIEYQEELTQGHKKFLITDATYNTIIKPDDYHNKIANR